ncbi:MAG: hypothetical protein PHC29_08435 [Candidatus Omnitrophica bacterium]|nr:hypothetical protein [Candidatus Omnitrophota bacterium]
MKIIIPSYNRSETISTHKLLKDNTYTVILHDKEQFKKYALNDSIKPDSFAITGIYNGISGQRQWILNNLIEEGEWFLTMDDNIKSFTSVTGELYEKSILDTENDKSLKEKYEDQINIDRLLEICDEMINISEEKNIHYCGFSTTPNFYFRSRKYRYVGYVISKMALIKKSSKINYDQNIKAMDDYAYTAENLLKFGAVLINNFVHPISKHYQEGGIGTYDERVEKKIADAKYLMLKYPGLFRYKIKSGCHPKAEIQIRQNNTRQINEWRREMFLKGKI